MTPERAKNVSCFKTLVQVIANKKQKNDSKASIVIHTFPLVWRRQKIKTTTETNKSIPEGMKLCVLRTRNRNVSTKKPDKQLKKTQAPLGLMVILCALILIVLFCGFYRYNDRVPTGLTNLLESFVQFVRDEIAVPSLGKEEGERLTPLLCTFFFFILGLNLLGQIPLFSTATANMSVTAPLALITFYFMTVDTVRKNGFIGFLKAFVPSGVPAVILPFIFFLEVLGVFIKTFALMVRLFANMLAGHMVILSLLGLVVLFGAWGLPAIVLAVGIGLLEILVVFLQAYIFVLLSAVFIGQMYHPEH